MPSSLRAGIARHEPASQSINAGREKRQCSPMRRPGTSPASTSSSSSSSETCIRPTAGATTSTGASRRLEQLLRVAPGRRVRVVDRERGGRRVEMTEVGEILLTHARIILSELSRSRRLIEERGGPVRDLTLGTMRSLSGTAVFESIANLLEQLPAGRLATEECQSVEELASRLIQGEIDAAIAVLPLPPGDYMYEILGRERFVLFSSPLAHYWEPSFEAGAARVPIAILRSCHASRIAIEHLQLLGLNLEVIVRSDESKILLEAARRGIAAVLAPQSMVPDDDHTVSVLEIESLPPITTVVLWIGDRPKALVGLQTERERAEVRAA